MSAERRLAVLQWLLLGAALFVLNASVTFQNIWPTPFVTTRHELSIELAVVLLALVAWAEIAQRLRPAATARRRTVPRGVTIALTVLLFAMALGRYAEVTAPALYGRSVDIYWDAQHVPHLAAMFAAAAPAWLVAAIVGGALALFAALAALLYWGVRRVTRALDVAPQRRALGAVALALVCAFFGGRLLELPSQYWFSLPVSATYAQQARFVFAALADAKRELPITPLPSSDLGNVAGADVLLLFLESYGATSYDEPSIASVVAPARADLERAAHETGRELVSAFVTSPTFGGQSWLAHSTLMSGFEVTDPGSYALLLTQRRETLAKAFEAKGYRSVAVMPGLKYPWPEGGFYGFDAIHGEQALDYHGPEFGWWRIPDQYALARLDALELGPGPRAPRFVFFPTTNTHIPFRPRPPYQSDWTRVLGPEPFDAADVRASLADNPEWTDFTELREPYARSLVYTFKYLAGYLRARPDADLVIVMLGDHQPAASVTGVGARWDVPVHVITSRRAVTASLRGAGFVDGVALGSAAPLGRMPRLTAALLRAFDSGAAGAPASVPSSTYGGDRAAPGR
jgi:hypothetical protein